MLELHAFAQSGNSFKVAFLLRALQLPHEIVFVDYMNGQTRDPAWRAQHNPLGEVPVLTDGTHRLVQSGAILTWLAAHHGRFDGRNERERNDILAWLLFDNHKFTGSLAPWRFMRCFGPQRPDPAVLHFLHARFGPACAIVEQRLSTQPFLVGDEPTIADFSLSGYLFYPPEEIGDDLLDRHPHIAAWLARLRAIPGWAAPYDVLPGERIAPRWTASGE